MSSSPSRQPLKPYIIVGLKWTAMVVASGALVGALAFPIVGALAGSESSTVDLALSGAQQLAFLAFVWAPGIGIVMAFDRAYRDRRRLAATPPDSGPR